MAFKTEIFARTTEHETHLVARCFAPMTKLIGAKPPYDNELVDCLIACEPRSTGQLTLQEHIPHPMDFGDELFEFTFSVGEANLRVLRATQFPWTSQAEALVRGLPEPEGVAELRDQALALARQKQEEFRLLLERSRRQGGGEA